MTAAVGDALGTVWAYRGSTGGRERLRRAIAIGSAVIQRGYRDDVRAGLAELGIDDDLDPGGLPIVDLQRYGA